jgi:prepilin-type N-terminal cleavage/methylation domain-containing protein
VYPQIKKAVAMRTFISNYIQSEKARREENGDAGFSLIELIVVVVVLGILAAIAIPIFLNIQAEAKTNALEAAAGNGASQAAAMIAQDEAVDVSNLTDGDITVTYADIVPTGGTAGTIEGVCVTATDGTTSVTAGPGCP